MFFFSFFSSSFFIKKKNQIGIPAFLRTFSFREIKVLFGFHGNLGNIKKKMRRIWCSGILNFFNSNLLDFSRRLLEFGNGVQFIKLKNWNFLLFLVGGKRSRIPFLILDFWCPFPEISFCFRVNENMIPFRKNKRLGLGLGRADSLKNS